MKILDVIYKDFTEKLVVALRFISINFGNENIINKKNLGEIESRNFKINNSLIKGYVFHGYGCEFQFKNDNLDIEFEDEKIGFTAWSFYLYSKKYNSEITEEEVTFFLNYKVDKHELRFIKRIYVLSY